MKTNQMMSVDLGGFRLDIEHKTGMGNLTSLWEHGNKLRVASGKTPLDLKNYLRSPEVVEFILEVERHFKPVGSTPLKIETTTDGRAKITGGKLTCIKTKRGRYGGGTWADLFILLDAATRLDPAFKVRVYDTFIKGEILKYRDDGGDEFKALCTAMKKGGLITDNSQYKAVALAIHKAILGKYHPLGWNLATKKQLKVRLRIETTIADAIDDGLVDSFATLFILIDKRVKRALMKT